MNILLITNTAVSLLNFRKAFIEKLIKLGNSVHVLIPSVDSVHCDKLQALGVEVTLYSMSRSSINPIKEMRTLVSLYLRIKRISPDITFSFFPKPVVFGVIASSLAGVHRNFAMLEGLGYCFTLRPESESLKKKGLRWIQLLLYKISLPLADGVFFLNEDDQYEILVRNKVKVRESAVLGGIGVNLRQFSFSHRKTTGFVFTMVSRLLIDKGVREYVLAAAYVKKRYPFVQFDFIGGIDDNLGGISKKIFDSWVSDGYVNFLGVSDNIKEHLDNASVFVLPSYREGVPRSTQEAMAVGCPIITTDVPGCRDTVIDGVNGFLVPPWDFKALAKKMIYFIENQSEIERMGKESRVLAERKFNEDVFCDKLIKLLINKD